MFSGGSWRRLVRKKSTTLVGFWTASWEDVAKACGFSQDVRGYLPEHPGCHKRQPFRRETLKPPMLAEARGTPYQDGKLWNSL